VVRQAISFLLIKTVGITALIKLLEKISPKEGSRISLKAIIAGRKKKAPASPKQGLSGGNLIRS
jgi:hypothetical protein